jgi:hypothetical protein
MQYYATASGQVWAFEDDVLVSSAAGELRFTAPDGTVLQTPRDLTPFTHPPIELSVIRSIKWGAIKVERDRRKAGGFKVGALWFHSDADSRIQHLSLKDRARDLIAARGAMTDDLIILGQSVRWKTMDGSFATVTAQLAFDIVAAAGDLDARLFAVAESHRAAMEAAPDPASYDFSAGWPETFGG